MSTLHLNGDDAPLNSLAADDQRVESHKGTQGRYVKGCRCSLCREAHRIALAEYRARRRAAGGAE